MVHAMNGLLLLLLCAATLPPAVQHALDTRFPNAHVLRVEEDHGRWEVTLEGEQEVTFDTKGTVLLEEARVATSEVPEAVLKTARAVGAIERCERITGRTKVAWELVVVDGSGARVELELTKSGALIKCSPATE